MTIKSVLCKLGVITISFCDKIRQLPSWFVSIRKALLSIVRIQKGFSQRNFIRDEYYLTLSFTYSVVYIFHWNFSFIILQHKMNRILDTQYLLGNEEERLKSMTPLKSEIWSHEDASSINSIE